MDSPFINFQVILDKYLLYAEARSQYNRLEMDDQKIIGPYLESLKKAWQEELQGFKGLQYIPTKVKIL